MSQQVVKLSMEIQNKIAEITPPPKKNPTMSDWCEIKGGVPHGTKIGVLLFICMINDLQPPPIDTVKFVDDTTPSKL